jgi:MFS family permease
VQRAQRAAYRLSAILWGWFADRFGRRPTLMITALVTIPIAPLYLLTTDYTMIVVFFTLQGLAPYLLSSTIARGSDEYVASHDLGHAPHELQHVVPHPVGRDLV